jgi:hypothetical protein
MEEGLPTEFFFKKRENEGLFYGDFAGFRSCLLGQG